MSKRRNRDAVHTFQFRPPWKFNRGAADRYIGHRIQCSEPSSPSVLEVGPDGQPAVVRLFSSPWTDYGKWGWDQTPYGAP